MNHRRRGTVMYRFIAALLLSVPLVVFAAADSRPDLLEVLEINGEITDNTASQVRTNVETIADNAKVKAVLLVVKSPGGGVLAVADVYHTLSKLKVPVVGWCDGICASGGTYVLMAPSVKYIAMTDEAINGSVGVVMQSMRFDRLLNALYIDSEVFKSGSLKVAGNPIQKMTDEERKYLQSLIDDFAQTFYAVVKRARPQITDWDAVKSARVFVGVKAVQVGLADAIARKDEAIAKAKELSGSKSIFTREELKKMSRVADDRAIYRTPVLQPRVENAPHGDIAWLIETLKEIRSGQSVRFSYRLPMEF